MKKAEPSPLWTLITLVLTVAIIGGVIYGITLALKAVNEGVESTKASLAGRGINITKEGVAVKTDKRAVTMEETQDKIQAGIMKGWKASTFDVPWVLSKGSNLAGSSHDKNKAEWEKTHGPKPSKQA